MEKETQKPENILDKYGISFHRKLSFKLFTIGILVVLLLIPKVMILSLIQERSVNAETAILDVTSKWSNAQVITGPILHIPYKKQVYNEEKEKYLEVEEAFTLLPSLLEIKGDIHPKKLYRSIYDVIVYESDIHINGNFEQPDLKALNIESTSVQWDQAELYIQISDLRGINREVKVLWSGEELTFSPGLKSSNSKASGISLNLPGFDLAQSHEFSINLQLKGSNNLQFTPVGKNTKAEITSAWSDPGFIGNFLPQNRKIGDDGFSASWNVLHFNRNYPQQWVNKNSSTNRDKLLNDSNFGVELVSMANHYQKNTRSAKYAILIIMITFVVFFMFEVFSKQRIHPFQYIMVGSAITLFYLLLLSFTEHFGFNIAYLVSALAVLILVVAYSRTFMPKIRNSMGVGAALAACFGFVFILLQLESFALLTGSVGLFVLLAILMYATRKVNWYKE